jgi:hypothetical protein
MGASFFISSSAFSTKTNFFELDSFTKFENFNYYFQEKNISAFVSNEISVRNIFEDRFWLANFLFNPTILWKYPNFIFYYNSWLYKSWQYSKKMLLQSLQFYETSYKHAESVEPSTNYFFSKFIRFFFSMWELNEFFASHANLGVGISHEFIWKQINLLHLKLSLRSRLISKIKEIWFYLKAYLRYFSYEGLININRSRTIFKKLFGFSKFLRYTASGFQLTTPALLGFLQTFYFFILDKSIFISFINIFYKKLKFLKRWYKLIIKSFIKSLQLLKQLSWRRNLTIFTKFQLLHYLTNFFSLRWFKKFKSLYAFPKLEPQSKLIKLPLLLVNFNTLLVFFLFYFKVKLITNRKKKQFNLIFYSLPFLITQKKYSINLYARLPLLSFSRRLTNIRKNVKYSDWFGVIVFQPQFFKIFLRYTYPWLLIWKKNFTYFYFILSNLTPKLFFWLFSDLSSVSHFGIITHFSIIYWQNFFFFYLFILKSLKKLYSLSSPEILLFLTRPVKLFMQRSKSYITLLDLFSSSFWNFLIFGLNCLEVNFTKGNKWTRFTLADIATRMVNFGKPNCWLNTTENKYMFLNKFSYTEKLTESAYFIPFISMRISSKVFSKKLGNFFFEKKNWLQVTTPFFATRIPTHLLIEHYSNLNLNSHLIAIFIKKKLEREHLVAEILKSLNLLLAQSSTIKGFMFLLKGRFSWWERASKIWLKKGKLSQVAVWTKIDYCKLPVTLKYGVVSIWVWLLLNQDVNNLRATI